MTKDQPQLKILIQPTNRMRFRYGSEKGSHGALTGSQDKKSFPTVKLENYIFEDKRVFVRASLYTHDKEPRLHVHRLRGPCCNDGICTVPVDKESMTAMFKNLSIEFVGKKEVTNVLYQRKKATTPIAAGQFPSPEQYDNVIWEEARKEANKMSLNVVRMCFEAIVEDPLTHALLPLGPRILSESISNQKATETGELKIVRMDKCSGCCTGGEEIFLLCDKVNKKDIQIQFYEEKNGHITWQGWGQFTEADVHYQVAIVFQTPPYRDQDISEPVDVFIRLYRKSDQETSEPTKFVYRPKEQDKEGVETKKRKVAYSSRHQSVEGMSSFKSSPSSPYSTSSGSSAEFGTQRKSDSGGTEGSLTSDITDDELINDMNSLMDDELINIILETESGESPLKDNSDDPYLSSTSSVHQRQEWLRRLTSDSISEENRLEEHMGRLTLQENEFSTDVVVKQSFTNEHIQSIRDDNDPLESAKQFGSVAKQVLDRLKLLIEVCVKKYGYRVLVELQKHKKNGKVLLFLFALQSSLLRRNENGENALHLAVKQEQQHENETFLFNLIEVMKYASRDGINSINNAHQTALHLAVACKRPPCVQKLLLAQADPTMIDKNGDTPLHLAASSDNKDCLQILLSSGLSKVILNKLNYNGKAPLHLAVESNHEAAVELLCEAGADVNVPDGKSGKPPLHYSVKFSSTITGILLKQDKIQVNLQDYGGNTPLHIACAHGLEDVVLLLMQNNADPLIENNAHDNSEVCPDSEEAAEEGKNAFYYASSNEKIIGILSGSYEKVPSSYSEAANRVMLKDYKLLSGKGSQNENFNKKSNNEVTKTVEEKSSDENTLLHCDSGYESREIHFLDNSLLNSLCCLLDPPSSLWEKLAVFLIDTKMLNRIRSSRKSPTKSMLRLHKGTFDEFVKMVELADLPEVLTLLQEHV